MTRLHAWERPHGGASRRLEVWRGALALGLLGLSIFGAVSARAQEAPPDSGTPPASEDSVGTLPPLGGAVPAIPPDTKPDAKATPPDTAKPAAKTETPPGKTAPVKPKQEYEPVPVNYKLAIGDTIQIFVLRHPELSTETTILPDGNIVLPVIKQMNVQGMTIAQVSSRVEQGMTSEINNPRVMTRVTRRAPREASVIGNGLRQQGKRSVGDEYRVLQLISDSGGLAGDRPEFINAVLFRKGDAIAVNIAKLLEGDAAQNRLIEDNDVFYVTLLDQSKMTITVQGKVSRPGDLLYPKGGSLQEVMTRVGPPLPSAWLSEVKLVRNGEDVSTIDMRDLLKTGEIKPDIKLKPGDVIIVPENIRKYTILGAVSRAGEFMYPDDEKLTVLTAISRSGNLGSDADLKKAGIFRKNANGKSVVIPVNLEKLGNPTVKTSTKTKSKSSKPADKPKPEEAKPNEATPDATKTDETKTDAVKADGASDAKSGNTTVSKQVATIDTELLPGDQLVIPHKGPRSGFNFRDILTYVTAYSVFRNVTH